jgi:hypothetical protein
MSYIYIYIQPIQLILIACSMQWGGLAAQLKQDLAACELEITALEDDRRKVDDELAAASLAQDEFTGLVAYGKRKLDAVRSDVEILRQGAESMSGNAASLAVASSRNRVVDEAMTEGRAAVDQLRKERDRLMALRNELFADGRQFNDSV